MPFKYGKAPLLIDAQANTDFPKLKTFISRSKSKHWRHKLSSKCRSKAHQMPPHVAAELMSTFDAAYAKAKVSPVSVAATYIDAIAPWSAWEKWSKSNYPLTLTQRKRDYKERYSSLKGNTARCGRLKC